MKEMIKHKRRAWTKRRKVNEYFRNMCHRVYSTNNKLYLAAVCDTDWLASASVLLVLA